MKPESREEFAEQRPTAQRQPEFANALRDAIRAFLSQNKGFSGGEGGQNPVPTEGDDSMSPKNEDEEFEEESADELGEDYAKRDPVNLEIQLLQDQANDEEEPPVPPEALASVGKNKHLLQLLTGFGVKK